jgi:hypothetical protein
MTVFSMFELADPILHEAQLGAGVEQVRGDRVLEHVEVAFFFRQLGLLALRFIKLSSWRLIGSPRLLVNRVGESCRRVRRCALMAWLCRAATGALRPVTLSPGGA